MLAGVQGLEPRSTGPKPGVLPLDDTPIIYQINISNFGKKSILLTIRLFSSKQFLLAKMEAVISLYNQTSLKI